MKPKNLFITLMAVFLAVSAAAQNRKQVRQYYYWINQAELAICDSNYQKASDCYHSAFAVKRANVRDAHFAFILNHLYHYNLERACEAFHFLVQAGDKAYNEYGSYLEDTTACPELWNCMKIISDTTQSLVDENLYNALEEIRREDQRVRTTCYENEDLYGAAVDHTDSLNFQKIQQIFQQYQDINEYNSGRAVMMSAVFIHFARLRMTTPDVFYEKMVKSGNLSAASYMHNYDYCYHCIFKGDDKTTYGTDPSYTYIINNTLFIRYPDHIQKINKNRKKLNVAETWEDYVTKVLYVNRRNDGFRFYPRQFVIRGDEAEEEQREKDERARYDSGEIKGVYYDLDPDMINF